MTPTLPSAQWSNPLQALLTDLYQLTMACGYWKSGRADQEAVFHLCFRHHPFQSGFTILAVLAAPIEYLQHFRYTEEDLAYLATLSGNDRRPLPDPPFLEHLVALRF